MDDLRGHLTPKVVHSSPDLPRLSYGTCPAGRQRSLLAVRASARRRAFDRIDRAGRGCAAAAHHRESAQAPLPPTAELVVAAALQSHSRAAASRKPLGGVRGSGGSPKPNDGFGTTQRWPALLTVAAARTAMHPCTGS